MLSQSCGLLHNWFAPVVVEILVKCVHQSEHPQLLGALMILQSKKNEGEGLLAMIHAQVRVGLWCGRCLPRAVICYTIGLHLLWWNYL